MYNKLTLKIIINIIIFLIVFFTVDNLIYCIEQNKHPLWVSKKKYSFKNVDVYTFDLNKYGRIIANPEIIDKNYENNPIVLFGCSFAWGLNLEDKQTFAYKLSQILKRPVINRAICAGGIQHMYYQTQQKDFYKLIPYSDTVIYIRIMDHSRRMLLYSFLVYNNFQQVHYFLRNGNLIMDNYKNPFLNFFKSLYKLQI